MPLENVNLTSDNYIIETSRKGDPTLKFKNTYLHSKYDPVAEGFKIANSQDLNRKTCIIILGLGLGYHITPFFVQNYKLIIIEKYEKLTNCLRQTNRIEQFHHLPVYFGDLNRLEDWLFQQIEDEESDSIAILEHPSSTRLDSDYYQSVKELLSQVLKSKLQSYMTTLGFSNRWHGNILKNLRNIKKMMVLKDQVDLPVFIIGSGPSLDQQLEQIFDIQDRGIIITLAPVYHRLIELGIQPHYVISTDGGIANRIHLRSGDMKSPISICVTSLSVTPNLFRNWKSNFLLINQKLPLEEYLLNDIVSTVQMQGSVSSSAFLFAQVCSRGPIYLIGLDFALTDRKYHYKGNRLEEYLLYQSNKIKTIETSNQNLFNRFTLKDLKAIDDSYLKSNLAMISYLNWLERAIKQTNQKVYNLNKKGAIIKGADTITYNQISDNLPVINYNPKDYCVFLSKDQLKKIENKISQLKLIYSDLQNRIKNNQFDISNLNFNNYNDILRFQLSRLIHKCKKKGSMDDIEQKDLLTQIEKSYQLLDYVK